MHYDASQENQPKESFVELQDSMVKELRAIARLSQDMVSSLMHTPFCGYTLFFKNNVYKNEQPWPSGNALGSD